MRHYLQALVIACLILLLTVPVFAGDSVSALPTLKIDDQHIDIKDYFYIKDKKIAIKGLDALSSFGAKALVIPAENRIVLELNNSKVSIQLLGAEITEAADGYFIKAPSRLQTITQFSAKQLNISEDNFSVELGSNGINTKTLHLIYDFSIKDDTLDIIDIKKASFNREASQYIDIYNPAYPLSKSFVPTNMTVLNKSFKAALANNSLQLLKDAAASLKVMLDQAYTEGIRGFKITSAYRSYSHQQTLFRNKVLSLSKAMESKYEDEAAKVVARPGTSEHQSGLAVDISINGMNLVEKFASTVQGKWLAKNSWKYGYIVRYNGDKTDITGIIYEPWHIRYVGYPHSKIIYDYNVCLEEYISNLSNYGFYCTSDNSNIFIIAKDSINDKAFESIPIQLKAN